MTRRRDLEGARQDLGEINDKLIIVKLALSLLDGDLKMKTEKARKILREVQEGIKEQADDITDNPRKDDNPELPTVGFEGQERDPTEPGESHTALSQDPELLDGWGEAYALSRKKDIHLWLADLKKTMDFDSREEAEGARKLVERAGWELGTHGYQILQDELEEDDGDTE